MTVFTIFTHSGLLFAALVAVANVVKHYRDPFKCIALTHHGHWLDPPERHLERGSFAHWQPPGCIFHEYTQYDIANCINGAEILFAGDTTVRQLFWETTSILNETWVTEEQPKSSDDGDLLYSSKDVTLRFIWDPWLNSPGLFAELRKYRDRATNKNNTHIEKGMHAADYRFVLIGGGLWHARYVEDGSFQQFKESIADIIWTAWIGGLHGNPMFFMPVIEPMYDRLGPSQSPTIARPDQGTSEGPPDTCELTDALPQSSTVSQESHSISESPLDTCEISNAPDKIEDSLGLLQRPMTDQVCQLNKAMFEGSLETCKLTDAPNDINNDRDSSQPPTVNPICQSKRPIFEAPLNMCQLTNTPEKVKDMNRFLTMLSKNNIKVLRAYSNMVEGRSELYEENGISLVSNVTAKMVQVLFNTRCNSEKSHWTGYPFNRTCCANYQPWKRVPLWLTHFAPWTLPYMATRLLEYEDEHMGMTPGFPDNDVIYSASILLLAASFCFLADRTQIFDKIGKVYSSDEYNFLLLVVCLFCLIAIACIPPFTNPLRKIHDLEGETPQPQQIPMEDRRGFAHIFFLAYSYVSPPDTSKDQFWYGICIFLFMYQHTMFLLLKYDFSLTDLLRILLRLNMFPILLSFIMDRPYTSYTLPWLISFWYLVFFATLKFRNEENLGSIRFLFGKVMLSMLLVTGILYTPGLLENALLSFGTLFRAQLNVDEIRNHLIAQQTTSCAAVLTANAHIYIASLLYHVKRQPVRFVHLLKVYKALVILLIPVCIMVFLFWAFCPFYKANSDFFATYFKWVPILLGFILWCRMNAVFMSFTLIGKVTLELQLLAQHIWLAGDGYGVLKAGWKSGDGTLRHDRWRDFVVLTPIFFWCAIMVAGAKEPLVGWIVPRNRVGTDPPRPRAGSGDEILREQIKAIHAWEKHYWRENQAGLSGTAMKRLVIVGFVVWVLCWVR
ncbi:hypothetical protein P154DRAFT_564730 [Amniculicola lignicola CBS 123094]|uniref:Cas1p 10 TM acyl transferase domain-containing protein n=1 Tax=Amniculicola lignicola CBS 123094 TaxID=1392246 RepID=A0A6A5WB36_9PLEO|nr:hypothetical protein P154DRAFT_564730 [Amniculicola lignicola CBS 123094]